MMRSRGLLVAAAMVGACSQADPVPPAERNDAPPAEPATGGTVPLALAASAPSLQWGPCPPIFTTPGFSTSDT